MVIVMQSDATEKQVQMVIDRLIGEGFDVHRSTGAERTILGVVGGRIVDERDYELMDGVNRVVRITQPYRLSSRPFRPGGTVVPVGDVSLGGREVVVMAGPSVVESGEQVQACADALRHAGVRILCGNAFKPRTPPHGFQGLGAEGLRILRDVARRHGMFVVSEVTDHTQIPLFLEFVDLLQVGARNMQNPTLLSELGRVSKPVLLNRGPSATIEEWLLAAERILTHGNDQVILCEPGIRTFESQGAGHTLDLSAVPIVKKLSHLPIVVDPSQGTGRRDRVAPMARAAVAAGADGLLIEVHPDPDRALIDGAQSLRPDEFTRLVKELSLIAAAVGRNLAGVTNNK